MKPDTLSALAVSVLVWLVAFPTVAEDSDKGKTTFAILSICRVEQHGEIPGGNPRIAKADGDAPVQAYLAAVPGWAAACSSTALPGPPP